MVLFQLPRPLAGPGMRAIRATDAAQIISVSRVTLQLRHRLSITGRTQCRVNAPRQPPGRMTGNARKIMAQGAFPVGARFAPDAEAPQ
ncbi:hypothetical protein [Methylobacterium sp. WSM2598]|uniref:hypothetical protein n=1 Tax=Methylobacterium sp. WSM2598 TaxID=398261 RepID=UPI0012F6BF7F|nr:hypothetical protein [Methylobacterium sp. WSM2598]